MNLIISHFDAIWMLEYAESSKNWIAYRFIFLRIRSNNGVIIKILKSNFIF